MFVAVGGAVVFVGVMVAVGRGGSSVGVGGSVGVAEIVGDNCDVGVGEVVASAPAAPPAVERVPVSSGVGVGDDRSPPAGRMGGVPSPLAGSEGCRDSLKMMAPRKIRTAISTNNGCQ